MLLRLRRVIRCISIWVSLAEDRYASIPSATQTVVYDALYSLYVPECYGYDFIKWEECESGNEFIDGV